MSVTVVKSYILNYLNIIHFLFNKTVYLISILSLCLCVIARWVSNSWESFYVPNTETTGMHTTLAQHASLYI